MPMPYLTYHLHHHRHLHHPHAHNSLPRLHNTPHPSHLHILHLEVSHQLPAGTTR